ncbi:TetR/AcrR family transcriptional regulator [Mycolicibacterium vaccae]|nr:TetR/AcrR family transcriptional regulator [Mycolicibacterium vaccae]MCV7061386.1 TetR/AcrR family transcriptional regulator [Mycolicibacterium vaccae]
MGAPRTSSVGRPRSFDIDEALDRAMVVFWERGFEGASLTDLTEAMGITRTSMYAAFGNKEELFRAALRRYLDGPGGYLTGALAEPTARAVAEAFLRGAVRATTRPGGPAGCLVVQGSLAAGTAGVPARDVLIECREDAVSHLRERFREAVKDGDLPQEADPGLLARYVMTVANGIAVQAANGVGRRELQRLADMALRHWPLI